MGIIGRFADQAVTQLAFLQQLGLGLAFGQMFSDFILTASRS